MSVISTTHSIVKLERNTVAFPGQRLSRIIAKADRNGNYPSENLVESLAVSVPVITDEEVCEAIATLMPHLKGYLQGVQDSIIREFRINHGRNEIPEDVFSIANCAAWLDENAKGDRVTKEYLAEWFNETYSAACAEWIQSIAPGIAEDTVAVKVGVMKEMISAWASPKASPAIPALKAMLRFTAHLAATTPDVVCARMSAIATKAQAMLDKKQNELNTDALGF